MTGTHKQRDLIFRKEPAAKGNVNSAGVHTSTTATGTTLIVGHQDTTSESHPVSLLGKTGRDIGGFFFSESNYYYDDSVYLDIDSRNKAVIPKSWFQGRVVARGFNLFPTLSVYSLSSLEAAGATAIARTLPTNPISSVGQFLGELNQDGIPAVIGSGLLKSRLKQYREYGSEYLNYQFGWVPFISDLLKFATAVKTSHEVLKQFERDSGKNIRRRYRFPPVTTTTQSNDGPGAPYSSPVINADNCDGATQQGNRTTTTTTTVERWFSGCYTYYVDMGKDTMSKIARCAQEADKLFGILPTPELVWQLAPWSWAADWVSNIGDVIHNVSAFQQDGLVMRWGYMMEKSTSERIYTLSGFKVKEPYQTLNLKQTFGTTRKVRIKASPYGFGLTYDGFTNRQLAIIAALGISRSGGKGD